MVWTTPPAILMASPLADATASQSTPFIRSGGPPGRSPGHAQAPHRRTDTGAAYRTPYEHRHLLSDVGTHWRATAGERYKEAVVNTDEDKLDDYDEDELDENPILNPPTK
jgi:hypothetical protein